MESWNGTISYLLTVINMDESWMVYGVKDITAEEFVEYAGVADKEFAEELYENLQRSFKRDGDENAAAIIFKVPENGIIPWDDIRKNMRDGVYSRCKECTNSSR